MIHDDIIKLVDGKTIVWFRRDLRLEDNAALYRALATEQHVLPLFIFDSDILDSLEDRDDARVTFIYDAVAYLKEQLEQQGTSLIVLHGKPKTLFAALDPKAVFTNHDYEPYAISRDAEIKDILDNKGATFKSFKDQVIFEKREVLKDSGDPYTVFTPYSKKWKAKLNDFYVRSYPCEKYFSSFAKISPLPMPTIEGLGFSRSSIVFPERKIPQAIIKEYEKTRNFPALLGTSKLGVHLRFGTVSIRKLARIALRQNETWLNELIWREFYQMILWHFPHVVDHPFRKEYERVRWRHNEKDFERWCKGETGYPMVDAGMRELNATGYMHNRVRMVVASFLSKHLLIDWRWGEAYFARKLLDFELASNNGSWQWAAGTGCDAAPYFRVFNPDLQLEKFDRDLKYVKRWIPEYGTDAYPKKMVDHAVARDRAIKAYQAALQKT